MDVETKEIKKLSIDNFFQKGGYSMIKVKVGHVENLTSNRLDLKVKFSVKEFESNPFYYCQLIRFNSKSPISMIPRKKSNESGCIRNMSVHLYRQEVQRNKGSQQTDQYNGKRREYSECIHSYIRAPQSEFFDEWLPFHSNLIRDCFKYMKRCGGNLKISCIILINKLNIYRSNLLNTVLIKMKHFISTNFETVCEGHFYMAKKSKISSKNFRHHFIRIFIRLLFRISE